MIALIDYDAGNICSVMNALDRLDVDYLLTSDCNEIQSADKVIFPGVGHAGAAMGNLVDKGLDHVIKKLKQPVLGICVGMQLLCSYSEEGNTTCLGIVPAKVKRFSPDLELKVPHMGWNEIHSEWTDHALLKNISNNDFVYFVHSYYVETNEYSIASAHYGLDICAAIHKENFYGIQFHAEKSGAVGEQILANFIKNII